MKAREAILFCFCGPAASGKSTICRELLALDEKLRLSISTTTRAPRGEEVDGEDYFFVTPAEFQKRISAGKFLEHAVFNEKHYGTEIANLEQAEAEGSDLLLDIDVQGAESLKKLYPGRTVVIFVFPPSFSVLEERFRSRGTEDEAKIQARLKIAQQEIEKLRSPGFSDYYLENDDLRNALKNAQAITAAERCRFSRAAHWRG